MRLHFWYQSKSWAKRVAATGFIYIKGTPCIAFFPAAGRKLILKLRAMPWSGELIRALNSTTKAESFNPTVPVIMYLPQYLHAAGVPLRRKSIFVSCLRHRRCILHQYTFFGLEKESAVRDLLTCIISNTNTPSPARVLSAHLYRQCMLFYGSVIMQSDGRCAKACSREFDAASASSFPGLVNPSTNTCQTQ